MDSFLISPEAEEQFSTWLSSVSPDKSSLLACNDPDARKAMIESVINAFPSPQHQPVLLDLSETRVTNLADDLLRKIGDPEELSPSVMIHIINMELSLLESVATDGSANEWAKDLEKGFPFPIHIYGDERLLKSLEGQPWKESVSPAALIGTSEARLPYQELESLVKQESMEPYQVADLLAMSGAIAHAEHWYQEQEEKGGHELERVIGLGEIALHRRDHAGAIEMFDKASSLINDETASSMVARFALGKGRLAFASQNWKKAISALAGNLSRISPEDSREEYGEINRMIGQAWEKKGEPEKAIESYIRAGAAWAEEDSFSMVAAKAYQHAAAICQNQFRFQDAKENFSKALSLAETVGDEFLQASLEDSIEAMTEQIQKKEKKGRKGLFGKLFS